MTDHSPDLSKPSQPSAAKPDDPDAQRRNPTVELWLHIAVTTAICICMALAFWTFLDVTSNQGRTGPDRYETPTPTVTVTYSGRPPTSTPGR